MSEFDYESESEHEEAGKYFEPDNNDDEQDEFQDEGDEQFEDFDDEEFDGGADPRNGVDAPEEFKNKKDFQNANQDFQDMKFDIAFIKKYYMKIRPHAKLRALFDKLNIQAGTALTGACAGLDYMLVLVKPKYANPNHKLDAVIEVTIIDEGVANMVFSPLRNVIDIALKSPPVQAIGQQIIKVAKETGVIKAPMRLTW